jgi:hypothetical protein
MVTYVMQYNFNIWQPEGSISQLLFYFIFVHKSSSRRIIFIGLHTPIILLLGKLKQEDLYFQANLGYIAILCLKKRWEGRLGVVSTHALPAI